VLNTGDGHNISSETFKITIKQDYAPSIHTLTPYSMYAYHSATYTYDITEKESEAITLKVSLIGPTVLPNWIVHSPTDKTLTIAAEAVTNTEASTAVYSFVFEASDSHTTETSTLNWLVKTNDPPAI
jgi:hypothetical protein